MTEDQDSVLTGLVEKADSSGKELGITLQMGGLLVSGVLVGHYDYTQELISQLGSTYSVPPASPTDLYSKLDKPTSSTPRPKYIHLKDAQLFAPGANPIPGRGVLWRGRLAEVDGFVIGTLVTGQTRVP